MTTSFSALGRAQRRYPILQVGGLILLFVIGTMTTTGFAQGQSIRSMLVLAALLGLASCGQTLVFIIGGLDLSVPGLIVMGSVLVSQLCGKYDWPLGPAIVLIVALAAVLGGCVGWICHRYRIGPLIVTLAMGSIALGAAVVWTHGQITGSAPQQLTDITAANGNTLGLPISPVVVIWAAVVLALGIFLHLTVSGRRLYATGDNPRAAALALVPTARIWAGVFAVSAILSALVGVLLAGFSGADRTLGDPYLFQGLTAVIIGGTAFGGSRGDYSHTALGALILVVLSTILVGQGYDTADQQIIFGILILILVAGYGRSRRVRDRI